MHLEAPEGDEQTTSILQAEIPRERITLAGVDEDPVAAGQKRLHGITVDRDHAQIGGTGPELVPYDGIGEEPHLLGFFQAFIERARAGGGAHVDFGDRPVAFRCGRS